MTGQTSDVAQGLYHLDERYRKKESDLDLTVKGGREVPPGDDGRPPSAMIEMTEMVSNTEPEEEEDTLRGSYWTGGCGVGGVMGVVYLNISLVCTVK